ncbi:MAG: hypothetical protein PHH82_01760 [Candidatus ainarchaeum sp.]|nr:hypothetical protein [Candidatus ainarchaeum sp.]
MLVNESLVERLNKIKFNDAYNRVDLFFDESYFGKDKYIGMLLTSEADKIKNITADLSKKYLCDYPSINSRLPKLHFSDLLNENLSGFIELSLSKFNKLENSLFFYAPVGPGETVFSKELNVFQKQILSLYKSNLWGSNFYVNVDKAFFKIKSNKFYVTIDDLSETSSGCAFIPKKNPYLKEHIYNSIDFDCFPIVETYNYIGGHIATDFLLGAVRQIKLNGNSSYYDKVKNIICSDLA